MPKYTQNLNLYEFDPETDDRNSTAFNVQIFLSDNWDKIDEFAGELDDRIMKAIGKAIGSEY